MTLSRGRGLLVLLSVAAVVGSLTIGLVGQSGAQVEPAAQGDPCVEADISDARATCVQGNFPFVPTNDNCQTRFGASNEFKVDPPVDATSPDGAVSGTVSGDGKTLNVTAQAGVVIVGVVVKGGPNFNAYPGDFPDMISPLVGGPGNIPAISHYTICYNFEEPTPPTPPTPETPGFEPAPAIVATPGFTG